MKSAMVRWEIVDEINLLEVVIEILNGILAAELQRVFPGWIERGERVIDAGGDQSTL
jgi:hypothetical protein